MIKNTISTSLKYRHLKINFQIVSLITKNFWIVQIMALSGILQTVQSRRILCKITTNVHLFFLYINFIQKYVQKS